MHSYILIRIHLCAFLFSHFDSMQCIPIFSYGRNDSFQCNAYVAVLCYQLSCVLPFCRRYLFILLLIWNKNLVSTIWVAGAAVCGSAGRKDLPVGQCQLP